MGKYNYVRVAFNHPDNFREVIYKGLKCVERDMNNDDWVVITTSIIKDIMTNDILSKNAKAIMVTIPYYIYPETNILWKEYNALNFNELMKICDMSLPTFRKAIAELIEIDIIRMFKNSGEKIFYINPYVYRRGEILDDSIYEVFNNTRYNRKTNIKTDSNIIGNCGIYKIVNVVNNKIYIGSSKNIKLRWRQHRSSLAVNRHCNKHLQNAWNKYGEENFSFEIIEIIPEDELFKYEQYWIDYYDSSNILVGYNICENANGPFSSK